MRKVRIIFKTRKKGSGQTYTLKVPTQMTDEEVKQMCDEAVNKVGQMCYSSESIGYMREYDAIYEILKEKGVCPEAYVMYIRAVNGYTYEKEDEAITVIY